LLLYWRCMQQRKLEELKLQVRMAGGKIEDEEENNTRKRQAEAWQHDPLAGFPDDIEYFTRGQCQNKIAISKRHGEKWPPGMLWDTYRMNACLGNHGRAARRCAMNDVLWERYCQAVQKGSPLQLETVRRMVLVDTLRRKLYPPDYRGGGEEPPPAEYLEALKQSGEYAQIMMQIDHAMREA
jgi:hypothetical protein